MPRGHNKLVLVVDDEDPILDLVQKVLKRYGYRVLLAKNGVEAVELYTRRQKEVDVVITDMVMPIMDGPATITALILLVSGIPLLEKKYEGNLEFKEYQRRTSAFFPLPPKP